MNAATLAAVLNAQSNEVTEHAIYLRLAARTSDPHNRKILERIAGDERRHFQMWEKISGRRIEPSRLRVWWYTTISRVFGLSFGLKLMEKGESLAQDGYGALQRSFSDLGDLIRDEQRHEEEILAMLEEERLEYAGSIVLGLNDALVELTGALAGLTLALGNGRVIAVIGLITGIAASLSMAASGYLSSREEEVAGGRSPLKSALYTGIAYVVTVALLILPYLLLGNVLAALGAMIGIAILTIAGYNFYITTAKGLAFRRRFVEMTFISLAVAAISFGIGWAIRGIFGTDL